MVCWRKLVTPSYVKIFGAKEGLQMVDNWCDDSGMNGTVRHGGDPDLDKTYCACTKLDDG
jgi:hypothetical protein